MNVEPSDGAEAAASRENEVETLSKVDFVTHNEVMIEAPPEKIWPHLLTLEWKAGAKVVLVDGDPTAAGATFEARLDDGTPLFRIANAEILSNDVRTIRLNDLNGGLIGYACLRLLREGPVTRVRYDVYSWLALPTPDIIAAAQAENSARFDRELASLKHIVEDDGRTGTRPVSE